MTVSAEEPNPIRVCPTASAYPSPVPKLCPKFSKEELA
jgi:hypothetical protein